MFCVPPAPESDAVRVRPGRARVRYQTGLNQSMQLRPALGLQQALASTVPPETSGVPASRRIMAQSRPVTPGSKGAQCENEVLMRDGSTQFKSCAQPARAVATPKIQNPRTQEIQNPRTLELQNPSG